MHMYTFHFLMHALVVCVCVHLIIRSCWLFFAWFEIFVVHNQCALNPNEQYELIFELWVALTHTHTHLIVQFQFFFSLCLYLSPNFSNSLSLSILFFFYRYTYIHICICIDSLVIAAWPLCACCAYYICRCFFFSYCYFVVALFSILLSFRREKKRKRKV